jgi:predicted  nucleic acid-binding Zn-ribbon protein
VVNLGKRLADLQQIDLDLEKKTETLSQVESQLSHNETLTEAKAEVERKREDLAELEKKQKTAEWVIDDLQAKAAPLQQKLYAGSVKNPKELVSLQQQMEQLKSQIREEEDKTLEIMGQVEALQKEVSLRVAEVKKLEREWRKRREQLSAEQTELSSAIDITKQKRSKLAATIEPTCLELYEALRARKQGHAVANIEQGRCQGCRITLSVSELTRARVGELVQCDSCGRILYLG